ncbi:MAG TPA: SDR family oxidoreductase [Candidatus Saccharimonadales bacterium]|nr:SDR family oxidoreductase [Candidatus Saccharimonadales bacterium]
MVVITGASDGLGLELAKLYQAEGKQVVNVSRRPSKYADINLLHDLSKGPEITAAAKEIIKLTEPLEVLVNCAGVLTIEQLGQISEAEIERTMAIHVKAPILLVSELLARIKKDGSDIVNVSSTLGTRAKLDNIVYGASKWALRGFSANLRAELKDTPSRVISFCPGGFETKIFEKVAGADNSSKKGALMSAADMAKCLKQLLDLPKNMEVAEIIIERKQPK